MILLYKYDKYIDEYFNKIESGETLVSKDMLKAVTLIKNDFVRFNIYVDHAKIKEAVRVIEQYFDMRLFDWEKFIIALIHCYINDNNYKNTKDMTLLYSDYLIEMGRGNGKNGFASAIIWYLTSYIHGIKEYNVDIIANSEDQAKTSFEDVHNMLDSNWNKFKTAYDKTLEKITSKLTNSTIKYNTSNAKTKDGKRSACLLFDEIHGYETYDNIKVFKSGFGKKQHSRIFYITTNGYVRDGVLDKELLKSEDILNGLIKDINYLPLLYHLDNENEAGDPDKWIKANPSINYLPPLKKEIKKHWKESQYDQASAIEFYTKRMNLPKQDNITPVAEWDQIKATNKPIPYDKLKGLSCIGAVDYALLNDFCSVGLLFKLNGDRVYIEHTFVCHKSLKIESRQIKFPIDEAVEKGLITIVYDDIISPSYLADWFIEQGSIYNINNIYADNFRVSVLKEEFSNRGLPLETVRSGPITHSKISPLVSMLFAKNQFIFGDNITMRWYINNTYVKLDPKGNTTYMKIEPMTRKTDGFFGLIHAITKDNELIDNGIEAFDIGISIY